jgi:hypothetical protein
MSGRHAGREAEQREQHRDRNKLFHFDLPPLRLIFSHNENGSSNRRAESFAQSATIKSIEDCSEIVKRTGSTPRGLPGARGFAAEYFPAAGISRGESDRRI